MGTVFRAVDTRLGRSVALKIVNQDFDARFAREARAIASLNHPNICTLYDVGRNYLVMELVEGETIAARLKSGPLPVKIALQYSPGVRASSRGRCRPCKALPAGYICPVQLSASVTGTRGSQRGSPRESARNDPSRRAVRFRRPWYRILHWPILRSSLPSLRTWTGLIRLGRASEAAAEFRKILDHPGLVLNDPIGPIARLQLARPLSACGDRASAATVDQDLLALWQDADPDAPVVQQATAERAELSRGTDHHRTPTTIT